MTDIRFLSSRVPPTARPRRSSRPEGADDARPNHRQREQLCHVHERSPCNREEEMPPNVRGAPSSCECVLNGIGNALSPDGTLCRRGGRDAGRRLRNRIGSPRLQNQARGVLNQFLRNISAKMGGEPLLVVTGGAASQILPLLDFQYIHDPWLVFRGMLVG